MDICWLLISTAMPDHWNTKPPLLIWFMALFLRFGFPPLLAVRLPCIMAATATVLLVFFFCRNVLHDRLAGLFAGLTLPAAPLFVGWHAGRTADYDSLVTLFTLLYTLAFWGISTHKAALVRVDCCGWTRCCVERAHQRSGWRAGAARFACCTQFFAAG